MRVFGLDLSVTNALPLVGRELRAESRRAINYGLRVLTAAVVVAVFAGFMAATELDPSQLGRALFDVLQLTLLLAMWIIVPMMTADCISREKREGTLGLLFLTPLSVLNVILGKAASHILHAATLLLASVPVLVLPFVLGGVVWQQALLAVAMIANALLLGIAAGLYASAKGGSAIQVMVMAEGYALVLAVVSVVVQALAGAMAAPSLTGMIWGLVAAVYFTVAVFWIVMAASVRVLRDTWDQDAAAPEQPKWVAMFSGSEFWQTIFHWERSKTLDRNPMAWLQEYSWTARLTKWGWCLAIFVAEHFIMFIFPGWQPQLTAVVALGVAFSATGSFRRERQTGLLEILLVTPLTVRQLMVGRLWGVFSHFCPALAVLIVCWNGDRLLNHREFYGNPFYLAIPNPLGFLALMVVGLYMSLWRLNFFVVWLLAWTLAFLLPSFAAVALDRFQGMNPFHIIALTSTYQLLLAVACWFLLRRNLEQRKFINAESI
jgi:ABC-type transport system involved in cytochrome c biogenesis permease component